MEFKEQLDELLQRNNINKNTFETVAYNYFMLSIFEDICNYLDCDSNRLDLLNKLRSTEHTDDIIKNVVKSVTGVILSQNEIMYIEDLVSAYLLKSDKRKTISYEIKKELLLKQEYKCTICNENISIDSSHLDHIVPWCLVGDELKNNYQMLCSSCNLRKRRSIIYVFKTFLKHRK